MRDEEIVQALRDLPPDLGSQRDRFELVRDRRSQRRERQIVVPLVVGAVIAVTAFVGHAVIPGEGAQEIDSQIGEVTEGP